MAHHGHKIDGQKHVLIKPVFYKILEGAQGRKTLCFFSMGLLLAGTGFFQSASAQQIYNVSPSNNAANTEIRLQQMETQLRDLTGKLEQQNYEIDQLKQTIINLQSAQIQGLSQNNAGASQIAVPTREAPQAPTIGGIKPPEIRGMQTATPTQPQATAPIVTSNDPTAQYETAFAQIKDKNYGAAQTAFESFLKDHDDHVLAANAKYWLGETFYVRGEFQQAAKTFAEGFQTYPESAKAPDILLKLGLSLAGMGKTSDACVALGQVPVKFPSAETSVLERTTSEMDRLNCGA